MNRLNPVFLYAFGLLLLAMMPMFAAAQQGISEVPGPARVTPEMLETRIAEAESAADLSDEAKATLIDLYRKSLSNLEEASANAQRAAAFEDATQTAPAQTQLIREKIKQTEDSDPLATLSVSAEMPLGQLEPLLQKEQADLAAVTARRTELERRLADQENRPTVIRQRLAEASQQQEETAAALLVQPNADEKPALTRARRWVLQTTNAALGTEIKMLDQELLSQGIRLDLLAAKRDQTVASIAWIEERVEVLSERVNQARQREAESAKAKVEQMQQDAAGSDPLLIELADRNAALTDQLDTMASRLDELQREEAQARKLGERVQADYDDARAAVDNSGQTEGLGEVLMAQREALPDPRLYEAKIQVREHEINLAVVQRLRLRAESRDSGDVDQMVADLTAQLDPDQARQLAQQLRDLVEQRQTLLQQALENDELYLARLRALDTAERELLAAVETFKDFLSEHLLWLGSRQPTRMADFAKLPGELGSLFSPTVWSGLAGTLVDQVARSPDAWLALLAIAALFWKCRALTTAIQETSARIGNPITDRYGYTLQALVLTLIAAAPLSLLLAAAGWQLQNAGPDNPLDQALGHTLFRVAMHLYVLRALRMICMPRGLAAVHFHWPESSLRVLRVELKRLTWVFVPALLVLRLADDLSPLNAGGLITRLCLLIALGALALFFYRVLHPRLGALVRWRGRDKPGLFVRTYNLWYAALVLIPLTLAALPLLGYLYSVFVLGFIYVYTLWMIVALLLVHGLALRWLRLVRRRLTYDAAVERREAKREARQAAESRAEDTAENAPHADESDVDLEALSDDTRELLDIATITAALVLLYLIWSPLLPALRVFEGIDLWYQTVTVDGEDVRVPITLANLILALLYAVGIGILAKRLPALLEIILLRRFEISPGSRYTIVILTNYAIIVIGVLLVVNTIGAQWSQLQWLVAALGVGIGFGLQEIVANFISGLIILLERPIRVGDRVTVGETDGLVTRIQIRATTIRNFDRKELLVPNKEFITGRLLNWSLSDQVTRIVIVVGVAYGSDVDKAHALMREAAEENEQVLDDPKPLVSFEGFGDNSLTLLLRAYSDDLDHRIQTITALHKAINQKLQAAGITIAFPQRDVHLDTSGPLRVSIARSDEGDRNQQQDSGSGSA